MKCRRIKYNFNPDYNPNPVVEWFEDRYHEVRSFTRGIYRYVIRVCKWLPFLWYNEDWDSAYAVQCMEFKLKHIAKCIEKSPVLYEKDRKNCLKRLHRFRGVLKRLEEDGYPYIENYTWAYSKKKEYIEGLGEITKLDTTKWKKYILPIAEMQRQDDLDYVAKCFKFYMRKWWD